MVEWKKVAPIALVLLVLFMYFVQVKPIEGLRPGPKRRSLYVGNMSTGLGSVRVPMII